MKYLNTYKLFESVMDSQFFKTKNEIENWLFSHRIRDYIINDDLTVDVKGNAFLDGKNLYNIPVQFGHIDGDFGINRTYIKSLKGCPHTVEKSFYCNGNELETLDYCPKNIGYNFFCDKNKLKNLNGCPKKINGHFYCDFNELESYNGCPEEVHKEFAFFHNPLDFLFYPIIQNYNNKKCLEFIKYLNEYDVIVDKKIYFHRFKEALYMIDLENCDLSIIKYLPKDFTLIN